MKGSAAIGGALVILAVMAGWYFFQKSDSDESQLMKEAYAAAAMKQEIVGLKSRQLDANAAKRPRSEIALQPEFEIALRAELRGDEQYANKDYLASIKSYSEALSNFKKVLGEFEIDSLFLAQPKAGAEKGNAKQNPSSKQAADATDEIRNLSQQSLERERKLQAAAKNKGMVGQSPTVFTPELPIPITTPKVEKKPDAVTVAATAQEESRQKKDEAKNNRDAKPEKIFATTPEVVNREAPDNKFAAADKSDESISGLDRGAQPEAQHKEQWEATARRAIANLIGAYQNSLAAKDLDGLKALFHGNFINQNEKAWSDFFAQATDLHASVEGKNYKINGSESEVDLVITIHYSNRKGIRQKPLRYSEGWTLERQNGTWTVVARRFE
jgi:hypothetical protein